jgi:membrane protease YdiL (CAAX protease family)
MDFVFIIIFLAVGVPLAGRRRIRRLMEMPCTTKRDRLRLYLSTVLSQWFLVAVIFWRCRVHRFSIEQLGLALPYPRLAALVSVALAAVLITNQLLAIRQLKQRSDAPPGAMAQLAWRIFPQDNGERLAFLVVVLTVAFCEEVIYRGFVQSVLTASARGLALVGIIASAVLFGVAHLYQGRRGLLATGMLGILFSLVRSWTRTLLPVMVGHFAADLTVGLLAPTQLPAVTQNSKVN